MPGQDCLLTPTEFEPTLQPPVLNAWVDQGVITLYWTGINTGWSYREMESDGVSPSGSSTNGSCM